MLVPWKALNRRHVAATQCTKRLEQKRQRLAEEEMRESVEMAFEAYGGPLVMVTPFKYLRHIWMASDKDWPVVVGNLYESQKIWARLSRIMRREGDSLRVLGVFFKAVVQALLLFGSETCVITPFIFRDLGGFQHRVARRITERQPQQKVDGSW